jgi:hypothetical protein
MVDGEDIKQEDVVVCDEDSIILLRKIPIILENEGDFFPLFR